MGYTLTIGHAKMEFDKEYNSLRIVAESKELAEAPAYGEPTDHLNERWPSYSTWHDFARFVGLHELFYDKQLEGPNEEGCLINSHPGYTVITPYHKEQIDLAYKKFYTRYPNCKPGYSPKIDKAKNIYEDLSWPQENGYAVRLEWLKYWVDWALVNCEIPIFHNS